MLVKITSKILSVCLTEFDLTLKKLRKMRKTAKLRLDEPRFFKLSVLEQMLLEFFLGLALMSKMKKKRPNPTILARVMAF